MLEMILNDVLAILRATFLTGDLITLGVAAGSVLIAVLVMRRGTQIGSMTLLALMLFAFGQYLRGLVGREIPGDGGALTGDGMVDQLEISLASFMNMTAATLLAYFIAFMVLIMFLFGAKAVFSRG